MTKFQAKCIIIMIWCVALLTPLPTAFLSRLVLKQQVLPNTIDGLNASSTTDFATTSEQTQSTAIENVNNRLLPMDKNVQITTEFIPSLSHSTTKPATVFEEPEKYTCLEQWSNPNHRYLYSILLMALQYLLPITVLIYTYSRIAFVVWIKKPPGEAQDGRDRRMAGSKRRMIKMMIMVVSVYTLCWLPLNTLIVISDLNEGIWQIK